MCAQPLLACRAREGEDLIFGQSDPRDAVVIVRLAAGPALLPARARGRGVARLRHLGARRLQLAGDETGQVNQIRDLLECAWPAVLAASPAPFRSASWRAARPVGHRQRPPGACPRTRPFLAKRIATGNSRMEIMRMLQRYIARELHLLIIDGLRAAAIDGST